MRTRGALLVFLMLAPAPAVAQTWYESYDLAEQALANERWTEAVRHLNLALEQRAQSSARARTYGMRFIGYFPYLKLGVAYHHLGQNEAALQAFATEESQGEIERSGDDLAVLEDYRNRIRQVEIEAQSERERRTRKVVAEALTSAAGLEEQGRLDEALAALARVFAVDRDHLQATAARDRLLAAIAASQRAQEREERFARLAEQGRQELEAGRPAVAAATLARALEIRADPQIQEILENAQRTIRSELENRPEGREPQALVELGLGRAAELESSGQLDEALRELQAVLALDPRSRHARDLEERILRAQSTREDEANRAAAVRRLVAEAETLLEDGDHGRALRAANRALALDPKNKVALECTAAVYAELSSSLLAAGGGPPSIHVGGFDDGQQVLEVRSPELVLAGTVYAATPVEVSLLGSDPDEAPATVNDRQVFGVWITDFSFTRRLTAGGQTYTVVATDLRGRTARQPCAVEYGVPFVRSAWFVATVAVIPGLAGLGLFGLRRRRRFLLLRRRFNPYVAGAPIFERQGFFGRQRLLDYVLRRIANNSVLLYGERRIGKTSLQHQLKRTLAELDDPDYQFYPVFVDLQGTPEDKFFSTLAADIFHELGPLLGGLEPSAHASYGYRDLVKDLQRVLKALDRRSPKKTKVVLLIDEVDELNDYDPRVNQKLRSLFMKTFADSLVTVVSGVAIKKLWEREGSPWYNFFQEIEVTALDHDAAWALVEVPVRGVFTFEEGVVDEIIRRADGKPYRIQRLCSAVVDRLHEDGRRAMRHADVAAAARAEELG